ncbi:MAG: glycosyltransferase family 39 protein [Armatimonadota bacterium]|nr:glycosyltransferase family 39 protein [Armatimonadota bacterium]
MRANGLPRRAWLVYDVLLALLLTSVAAVRLYKLGAWSFWVDEMFTLRDSLDKSSLFHHLTYPLSYILIGAAMKSGGVNEWTARIVPCVVGIATPAAVYLLARREFGRGPALGAAALLAVSPWHLYWSQMARFYTMTMLFSAAAALLFFSGYERKSPWRMGAAAFFMVLAALSHYSAFLVMGALIVYTIADQILKWPEPELRGVLPRSRKKALLSFYLPFGIAGIAIAPKALLILRMYSNPSATTGTSFDSPLKGAVYVVFSTFYRVEFAVAAAAILSAIFLLRRRDRRGLFLTALIAVPLAALAVAGVFSRGENRYALVTLPAFAVLAGFGMTIAYDALRGRSRALAAVAPIVLLLPLVQHSAMYFSSLSGGERWNYRAAAELIRQDDLPGDLVLTPMSLPMGYYLKDSGLTVRTLEPRKLDLFAKRHKRIWFVVEDSTRGRSASLRAKDWLRRRCDLVAHFPASSPMADYGVSVYLLEWRQSNGRTGQTCPTGRTITNNRQPSTINRANLMRPAGSAGR